MDHGPGASGDDEAHTLSSLLSMLNNKEVRVIAKCRTHSESDEGRSLDLPSLVS